MNYTGKLIPLPLGEEINRCLAHGIHINDPCERRETCACHMTIKHDRGLNTKTVYRKCNSDLYAAYMPLDGWPAEDAAPEKTEIPALVFYPAGSLGEEVQP